MSQELQLKPIRELDFGYVDARQYLGGSGNDFFSQSFLKSSHLDAILSDDVYFMLGEKGTGKTAYAVYISNNLEGYNGSMLFVEPFDYDSFVEISQELKIRQSEFQLFWSFALLLALHEQIRKTIPSANTLPRFQSITAAINRISLGSFNGTISAALALGSSLTALCRAFADELRLPSDKLDFDAAPSGAKLNFIIQQSVNVLMDLDKSAQLTLFIDGLDVRPEGIPYDPYVSIASGLAYTIWGLNSSLLSRINGSLRIVLLIRPDIIDAISLQNRGTNFATMPI